MNKILVIALFFVSTLASYAEPGGTLIVVNKGDNTASLLDLKKGTEVARIETGRGPHEVAVSSDGKTGIVTNYGDQTPNNSLTVIDIPNKRKVKEIELGKYNRPHGVEFVNNHEVLVTSETQGALIKVNVNSGTITEVGVTDQKAGHMVAHAKGDHYAYVSNIVSGSVSKLDLNNNSVTKIIEVKAGIEGIDVDSKGKEIWVANRADSTVTVIDAENYATLANMKAHRVAFRVKVLPNSKHAVVSNGESGNLSIYDVKLKKWIKDIDLHNVDKGDNFKTIPIDNEHPPIPVGIATSTDSHYIFVACANYDLVAIIDTNKWEVAGTMKTGPAPDGVYFSSYSY